MEDHLQTIITCIFITICAMFMFMLETHQSLKERYTNFFININVLAISILCMMCYLFYLLFC